MKPPYEITAAILKYISSISEKIGAVNAKYIIKTNPTLRKQNQIKTIHSSLRIEGNTLTEEQITAIIENKRVVGPEKDILEVLNALEVYKNINNLHPEKERDFLKAHQLLLQKLIDKPGKYRNQGVGIVKGSKVEHIAPPFDHVPFLMKDLFEYLKDQTELTLIKSCVFHYEMEFIHPFLDGNGRMGRLWQTLILMQEYAVFEFLPFETLISKNQEAYYKALSQSDKERQSTRFIEYMLSIIDHSLAELLENSGKKLTETDRITMFLESNKKEFTRKEYLSFFKDISSATASRDLKKAVEDELIEKKGDKKTTTYIKR
ncbi:MULTISPECIES: Fic family protein [unclassified Myroides]|uniref:Fic family protein n=1 Tax=unclassified Myroides TaxID=2642485 RepID=UPI003D2F66F4